MLYNYLTSSDEIVYTCQIQLTFRECTVSTYRLRSYALSVVTIENNDPDFPPDHFICPHNLLGYSMALEGRFAIWLLACVLLAQTSVALGQLVAALLYAQIQTALLLKRHPTSPPPVWYNILIDADCMPGWLPWLQALFPFSYFLRLNLSNEVSEFTKFSLEEDQVLKCVKWITNALGSAGSGFGDLLELHDDTSTTVRLWPRQADTLGRKAISK